MARNVPRSSRRRFLQTLTATATPWFLPRGHLSAAEPSTGGSPFRPATCEGRYGGHLQGICTNQRDAIYWSFTVALVKTDPQGGILKRFDVPSHHGDLCFYNGRIYVATNLGKFNRPAGEADSWVYVYDAETLADLGRKRVPELVHGAGGMAWHNGRFLIVGGLPEGTDENYLYEYDEELNFRRRHVLSSGYTKLGIQTAEHADGQWWFGCYGSPAELVTADEDLKFTGRSPFDCAIGIVSIGPNRFLIGRNKRGEDKRWQGSVVIAEADSSRHLHVISPTDAQRS